MEPVIKIDHLSFAYPDGRSALRDVTLAIRPGEKIGLIGPNGAGKSTLLLHLNAILLGSGSIRICGMQVDPTTLRQVRALVGVVFQSPDDQLFSPTVFDDVAFGPIYQQLSPAEIQTRVDQALEAVHMGGFAGRVSYHLSIGEKKRVAIATVLSMRPEILVLDEPSAGLDPRARRELMELFKELPQTLLLATHDLEMVRALTTRTIAMDHGEIVADGDTDQILADRDLLLKHGLL